MVGAANGLLDVHALDNGALLTSVGHLDCVLGSATGLLVCFNFSAHHFSTLACEHSDRRLTVLTSFGLTPATSPYILPEGCSVTGVTVALCANNDVIVVDKESNCVRVLSAQDGELVLARTWGCFGTGDGQFEYPVAVAVVGPSLYILDRTLVQVFE